MTLRAALSLAAILAAGAGSVAHAEGDPAKGETQFVICGTCHTGQAGAIAPDLHGVIGRTAGTAEGFELYTAALKNSGIVWTEETLSEFLTMPAKMVPGTTMAIPITDPVARADLIAYLKTMESE